MKTGDRIRRLRKMMGMKHAELAELIGTSSTAIHNWENNTRLPNAESLRKLSYIFSVSADYLLCLTDSNKELNEAHGVYGDLIDWDERKLLTLFSKLDERGKKAVLSHVESEAHLVKAEEIKAYRESDRRLDFTSDGPTKFVANFNLITEEDGSTFSKRNNGVSFIDEGFAENGADFCLTFSGKSMKPTIEDGDVLFISRKAPLQNGDTCLIETPDGIYIKNYFIENEGSSMVFKSKNPNYRDTDLSCSPEDMEAGRIKYLGKLVKSTHYIPGDKIIQTSSR